MEHHHDSYTQTQQQTPLAEHTATHHDKKLESPTCTDFASSLENIQPEESTVDTYELEEEQSLDETLSYNGQQPAELGMKKTTMNQLYVNIGGGDDHVISTMNNLGETHSLDIDETVDECILEPRAGQGNSGDDHAQVFDTDDATMATAEIATNNNNTQQHEQPSNENNNTVSSEEDEEEEDSGGGLDSNNTTHMDSSDVTPLAMTSERVVNVESLGTAANTDGFDPGDTNGNIINNNDDEMDDSDIQQRDSVDQLNTNMTSGNDKGGSDKNCLMDQSVDLVDTHLYDRANSPSPSIEMNCSIWTSSLPINQETDPTHQNDTQHTDQDPQHSSTDNTSGGLNHTTATAANIETPVSEGALSPSSSPTTLPGTLEQNDTTDASGENDSGMEEQQQQLQLDGDEHILDGGPVHQSVEDCISIAQFISTTPTIVSGSMSTGESQPSHNTPDEHQQNRMDTIGTDEHTLTEAPRPRHVWESDRQASECRRCSRRFSFLVRRHHCRRCGQIVCDRCSSHRVRLPVEEIVEDPLISTSHYPMIALNPQRVCESCIRIPIKATGSTSRYSSLQSDNNNYASNSTLGFGHHRLQPMDMERTNSQQSLMTECPVCGTCILVMGKQQQENHLNQCLNTGSPTVHPPRYIVYTLTEGTAQLGDECPICFEEFEVGDKIARMVCLCSYHRHCLRDWLERGKGCPIHYDSNFGAY